MNNRGRVIVLTTGILCLAVMYAQNINLNVVVADIVTVDHYNPNNKTYVWTTAERGAVLMAFHLGYSLSQIIGTILSDMYGPKIMILTMTIQSTLICIISPSSIIHSPVTIFIVRLFMGFLQGGLVPSLYLFIANWTPKEFHNKVMRMTLSGTYLGATIAFIAVSGIAKNHHSWNISFYIFSGLELFWCSLWLILVTDFPSDNCWLKQNEINHLESKVEGTPHFKEFPVRAILRSLPFWTLTVAHIAGIYSLLVILTYIPFIIEGLFSIQVKDQTKITFMVPVVIWIGELTCTTLFDFLMKKCPTKKLVTRKIFNIIGLAPVGLLMIFATLTSNSYIGIFLILLACFLLGFSIPTAVQNTQDIAQEYFILISGIYGSFGSLFGAIGILITSTIVVDKTKSSQWQLAIGVMIIFQVIGSVLYTTFADISCQSWGVVKTYTCVGSELVD